MSTEDLVNFDALSDGDLLDALLGTPPGVAGEALEEAGGLKALATMDTDEVSVRLLGRSHALMFQAALELGRRTLRAKEVRPRLTSAAEIAGFLLPQIGALPREVFHVLCFNSRNVLLRDVRVAEGTVDSCTVDPREVFAPAIACRAIGIVLAHNHPSGSLQPSAQDLALTSQLVNAARLLSIRVLDHVIIGDGGYHSMAEVGELPSASVSRLF